MFNFRNYLHHLNTENIQEKVLFCVRSPPLEWLLPLSMLNQKEQPQSTVT